jgi:chromosome segregation ATPase
MTSIEALNALFEKQRAHIDSQIADAQVREQQLAAFRAKLEAAPGIFDADDVEAVQSEIDTSSRQIKQLLDERRSMSETQDRTREVLLEASNTLRKRTEVLEKADGELRVLENHPELCRHMAKKHVELQALIQEGVSKLTQSLRHRLVPQEQDEI